MKGCTAPGCLGLGKFYPSIKVRLPDNDRPFSFDFNSYVVCEQHKKRYVLKDIITPEVLKYVKTMFKNSFLTEPKLSNMKLEWVGSSLISALDIFDSNDKKLGVITDIRNKDMGTKI